MAEKTPAEEALAAAASFLAPVLLRQRTQPAPAQSIIELLAGRSSLSEDDDADIRFPIITRALQLLLDIDIAFAGEDGRHPGRSADLAYQPSHRRTIHALLDLVTLEGIYPLLSPGVGIPLERRVKSVLPPGAVVSRSILGDVPEGPARSLGTMEEIADILGTIMGSKHTGLGPTLRDRGMIDLVSALGELAYGPSVEDDSIKRHYQEQLMNLLDDTALSKILPLLTSTLHPATPPWLRSPISKYLSLLPLRRNGVQQIIDFIASSTSAPAAQCSDPRADVPSQEAPGSKKGPQLSLEALTHASRLLASVPSTLDDKTYYKLIAPQLFDLLDGAAGPEMSKAAGFIIGSGILRLKIPRAASSEAWVVFVGSMRDIVKGAVEVGRGPRESTQQAKDLDLSLTRLSALISSHPNPGLTLRLLKPLRLHLWAIWNWKEGKQAWRDQAIMLLQTYFKVSTGLDQLTDFTRQLLWDGTKSANPTLGPHIGPSSEFNSHLRTNSPSMNLIERVADIDRRVENFITLLDSGVVDDEQLGSLFLAVMKRWLGNSERRRDNEPDSGGPRPEELLVDVKLIQAMLGKVGDKLGRSSTQLLELVKQLLDDFVDVQEAGRRREESLRKPSYSGLQHIVAQSGAGTVGPMEDPAASSEETAEILTMALSLLSTVLSSIDLRASERDERILVSILPSLAYISTRPGASNSIRTTASNLLALVDFVSTNQWDASPTNEDASKAVMEDRKTQSLALSYLSDPIPPVRAQGLHLLTDLIRTASPTIDIPSTCALLISILQDSDEFIHLNAIKSLSTLADKHSITVTKLLVERYVDSEESLTLDQRLRLGEALLQIVQRLGEALVGEAANSLSDACLAVAGRRARKPKAADERAKRIQTEDAKLREAEDAWGGKVPEISDQDERDESREGLAAILSGWEGRAGSEEDLRIRTSALSVLGIAIETNISGLSATRLSATVDLALSVLTTERGDTEAILRRAAVLILLRLVRAVDAARKRGLKLGYGLWTENLKDFIRVLTYVHVVDGDAMVREHASAIRAELETAQYRSLLAELAPQEAAEGEEAVVGERLLDQPLLPMEHVGLRSMIQEIE